MTIRAGSSRVRVAAGTLAAAGLAWLVVVSLTGDMPSAAGMMGPGAAAFVGVWTVMMAAMMLPALAPLGVLYAGEEPGRTGRAVGLIAGYLAVWAAFGVLAFLVSGAAAHLAAGRATAAGWAGAALLIGTGIYQISSLKHRCLSLCRSPLHLLAHVGGYRGRVRHIRAGVYHGTYCVACCWSLMVALIALGMMDLRWMVALTIVITLEKTWRHGPRVAVAAGIGLIVLGFFAPSHPGIVSGLHHTPSPMVGM